MKKLNLLFYSIIAGLLILGLGTIALCIWVLESWWARIGLIMGMGFIIMMVFYGTVFWLAAKANRIGLEAGKCSEPSVQGGGKSESGVS